MILPSKHYYLIKKQHYSVNDESIFLFLNDIYKKTELCLALINSDKNRCKRELKELKKTIKATKINEVQGEIDIYESEMVKMKTKLESAYEKIAMHEKKEKEAT